MHLISPKELKLQYPVSDKTKGFISESRRCIARIFERQDPRLLIVVGPCSIHNVEEGLSLAKELKRLADEVKDSCFLVMRTYIEKPRTRQGWKGLVHDPHLNGSHDIDAGLAIARSFLVNLAEIGLPAATEFLTPHLAPYIEDLISWGCIGARTSSSQIHRLLASYLPMPVGFKNSVDGNVDSAIHGVHVARTSHAFMHICENGQLRKVQSTGNPHTHVILRGSLLETNFDRESVQKALSAMRREEIPPRVLIDCSHGNSQGHYFKQKEVFQSVLEQVNEGNNLIMGMMLETNLEAGLQKIPAQLGDLQKGVSVTDACLDFSSTAELIESVSLSRSMSLTQS
ncbi:MAG: Phospho-2-dehydro-3-deoxyheptonate aldolase, Tyr-sensitive [Chlamydiae bacterium]|nr:Phospho-2-dehydro-3-deoxyheptonate aldolase, Tyr-sensitive [Chlamydiota bacterium]